MLVSWNWLNELLDIPVDIDTIAEKLTVTGNEIESIEAPCEKLSGVIVAKITKLEDHPSSDKLKIVHLEGGKKGAVCVTAATNLSDGDVVPYAAPGSVLADGTVMASRDFKGVESAGMLLSADELGLPDIADEYGILRLPADAPVGEDVTGYLGLDDRIMELSITPNRGDMLSMRGVAREVQALFPEVSFKSSPSYDEDSRTPDWPSDFKGVFLDGDACPVYSLGMLDDVKVAPSPLHVRIRLAMAGIRPVSNIVDATNLTMITLGQPLHAFDGDSLPGSDITVKLASEGESFEALDHKERTLSSEDLVITSGGETIGLAGVMGGLNSEIKDDTRQVYLESASFSSVSVGKTSRRLGIPSDASYRYARGVDPEITGMAVSYFMSLIREWNCGVVCPGVFVTRKSSYVSSEVTLTRKKLNRITMKDDMEEASQILTRLGLPEISGADDARVFSVPSWRPDISIEEDLIEEVARINGYDSIPACIPGCTYGAGRIGNVTSAIGKLRLQAVSRGYVEIVSYAFQSPRYNEILNLQRDPRERCRTLSNPLSFEMSAMRTTMIPGLLESLKNTLKSGWREPVRLFESGRVFTVAEDGSTKEKDRISGLVFAGLDRRSPYGDSLVDDLMSVKADVESLAQSRQICFEFVQAEEPFGHLGQTAHIVYDGSVAGYMLRLKPSIEKDLDFAAPVYIFELDLDPFVKPLDLHFEQGSSYPPVFRDMAMLVSKDTPVNKVEEDIRSVAGDLMSRVALFDIYEGKGIPEGKRSLAFSMAYQRSDRTLLDSEVESVHGDVRDKLATMGYILR